MIIVSSPSITKDLISKDPDEFVKGESYRGISAWLNNSLLLSEGDRWRHKRSVMGQAFRLASLKAFVPIFNFCTLRLAKLLDERIAQDQNKSSTFDSLDLMTRLTQDIIGLSAFGYDFHSVPSFPHIDEKSHH